MIVPSAMVHNVPWRKGAGLLRKAKERGWVERSTCVLSPFFLLFSGSCGKMHLIKSSSSVA